MQRHLLALAAVLGVVLPPVSGNAQRADLRRLVIGTWELDVAKSTFRPGPPPKSWTRVYEASGENVKYTDSTVAADGKVDVDRKSTRLNSSHRCISYAVFCLKKKLMST